ncbi:MAG: molybdopterin-dependent oxidoreductase, partial [Thermoanaerobaculum sp.]
QDPTDGTPIQPELTFLSSHDRQVLVELEDFAGSRMLFRGVPARKVITRSGEKLVTTGYDLLMAQYGVNRGLGGDYPRGYDDEGAPYTPAWQEKFTGIGRQTLLRFAREWGSTAERTQGKCLVIIGAGINHWYHNNLMYRAAIHALMFCGCVGVNGGGLAHYVGQEKLAPMESWSALAFARDWVPAIRLQNAPSWHYVHSDQWRYERQFAQYHALPPDAHPLTQGHTMDLQVKAVRWGWLPFYPQFNCNPLEVVAQARQAGAQSEQDVVAWVVEQLKQGTLNFAVEDPDAPENWPRVWFIWRGNALMSSAKGHEYFLKHYLGTHTNAIAPELAQGYLEEVRWRQAVEGKLDLVVDLNFRMDTSALYADVVLPAATWYEKADLNSTDLHSFIHPLSAAVPPCWESKSDWQIFRAIAQKFSQLAAPHFPQPVEDLVAAPLAHDTPAKIAQPSIRDWKRGEVEPIPGKTMPNLKVVVRDYRRLGDRFQCWGRLVREN